MTEQSAAELRLSIANLLGWTGLETSGLTGLLYGFPPGEDSKVTVPEWTTDPGVALLLCYEISQETDWTLIVYHERTEDYIGPVVTLERPNLQVCDFYGKSPGIMCDLSLDERMAYALAVAARDALEMLGGEGAQ